MDPNAAHVGVEQGAGVARNGSGGRDQFPQFAGHVSHMATCSGLTAGSGMAAALCSVTSSASAESGSV
jgi:hypothetical protein